LRWLPAKGLGVIGPSASGKSSLVRAMVGAWQPARGAIRLDGAAIDQWSADDLGENSRLFAGRALNCSPATIAHNICRFKTPTPPRIRSSRRAKTAGIHDIILRMPAGYETRIGDGGFDLSAGQAQRVALARALYGDPFLVVLDEPNSNLDGAGEQALTQAIMSVRFRKGIVVIVAHRPSALAGVDHVLVMDGGQAKAFGSERQSAGRPDNSDTAPASSPTPRQAHDHQELAAATHLTGQTAMSSARCRPIRLPASSLSSRSSWLVAAGLVSRNSPAPSSFPGRVAVDSSVKKVQHPIGGVVAELKVRDGDKGPGRDLLLRLSETQILANLAIINGNIDEAYRARRPVK